MHVYKYVLETQSWDILEEIRDVFCHCEMVCNNVCGSCGLNTL